MCIFLIIIVFILLLFSLYSIFSHKIGKYIKMHKMLYLFFNDLLISKTIHFDLSSRSGYVNRRLFWC